MDRPRYREPSDTYRPNKAERKAALNLWARPEATDRPAQAKKGTVMRRPRLDRLQRYADFFTNLPPEKRGPGSIYDELGQDLPALLSYVRRLESGLLRMGSEATRKSPEWMESAALALLGVKVPPGYHFDYNQRVLVKDDLQAAPAAQKEGDR